YFLQTIRGVPLGYEFSLYSYGPFDSDVLSDLQTAENMGILSAEVEHYSGVYKYDIRPAEKAAKAKTLAKDFLENNRDDIAWATKTFANRSAAELELLSTIVYLNAEEGIANLQQLAERVKTVKPHFSELEISRQIHWLNETQVLLALALPSVSQLAAQYLCN